VFLVAEAFAEVVPVADDQIFIAVGQGTQAVVVNAALATVSTPAAYLSGIAFSVFKAFGVEVLLALAVRVAKLVPGAIGVTAAAPAISVAAEFAGQAIVGSSTGSGNALAFEVGVAEIAGVAVFVRAAFVAVAVEATVNSGTAIDVGRAWIRHTFAPYEIAGAPEGAETVVGNVGAALGCFFASVQRAGDAIIAVDGIPGETDPPHAPFRPAARKPVVAVGVFTALVALLVAAAQLAGAAVFIRAAAAAGEIIATDFAGYAVSRGAALTADAIGTADLSRTAVVGGAA
jgi:hypothetical protein